MNSINRKTKKVKTREAHIEEVLLDFETSDLQSIKEIKQYKNISDFKS